MTTETDLKAMDYWISADRANGGAVHSLTDSEVSDLLNAKAASMEAKGLNNSAKGIREALAKTPDDARSYLAMMRVVGGAAKSIKAAL